MWNGDCIFEDTGGSLGHLRSDWLGSGLKVKHHAKEGGKILTFYNDEWPSNKNQPKGLMSVGE